MKKKLTVLAAMLVAVVVTGYSVSGTYAKYTSEFTGESNSARVAKWEFSVNEGTVDSEDFTFDLFDALLDSDGSEETDVESADSDFVIAPGTQGSVEINLANDSEVNAKAVLAISSVDNLGGIPVEFSFDGQTWFTEADIATNTTTDIEVNMNGGEEVATLYWRWPFNDSTLTGKTDADDTALGIDGTDTITVSISVTAEQID